MPDAVFCVASGHWGTPIKMNAGIPITSIDFSIEFVCLNVGGTGKGLGFRFKRYRFVRGVGCCSAQRAMGARKHVPIHVSLGKARARLVAVRIAKGIVFMPDKLSY